MNHPVELAAVFVLALTSSVHCVGMCGGFAATIGAAKLPFGSNLARQMIYSVGRVCTYSFFGATGGYAGLYLSRFNSALVSAQQVFSILAGVMMILIGASTLGLVRLRVFRLEGVSALLAPMFNHFLHARGRGGFFLAGLANGFLPCGLVYAFLASAVATGDMFQGLLIMATFGVGTVPAMLLTGCGSSLLTHTGRLRVYRLAAVFILLAGVMTIKRAIFTADAPACHEPPPAGAQIGTSVPSP